VDASPDADRIWKLMIDLSRARLRRMTETRDWSPTDPHRPQSPEEQALINELSHPRNYQALGRYAGDTSWMNPVASEFFRKLLSLAERRSPS
jgi:hypothetical protein